VANVSPRMADIAEHPDLAEMRLRYRRVLDGGQAVAVDGIVLLTGLYLAISPWVLGFAGVTPRVTVSNLVLGLAVAVIGLGLAQAPLVMYRLSWAMVGIGIWTLIVPFVTASAAGHTRVVVNNVITGGITALLGLCAVAMLMSAARRARA
jgi:SPW repeat